MTATNSQDITARWAAIILDSIADGVFTVDEGMRITSFNRAAERITGVSMEQAVGQYCFEVLRANICENVCALRHSFDTGEEIIDKKVDILRSDGRLIPVSISTAVMKDASGVIVGGVESFRDLSALEEMRKEIVRTYTYEDIVSKNHRIQGIFDILPRIADSGSTVLLQGPSGSGKELFARAIHHLSPRSARPFVALNCGALPDTLLESELFGYVRGAFTDARRDKPGRFALAQGGTLFLDEVDSLSAPTQVKLLRVLQEREYQPLGATAPIAADVRVIAATKSDLAQLVQANAFRDDLYFRLNVIKIDLPALAERREDIPLLVHHFMEKFNRTMHRKIVRIDDDALRILMGHDFPGNVRELENIMEHAFVMCEGDALATRHLPSSLLRTHPASENPVAAPTLLEDAERRMIVEALERHAGSREEAARELQMHRSSLWRKMKRFGLI
jgi:PAS domain S-box-containing protein